MALAHAIEHEVFTLPGYVAGEDLRTKQFYWVKEHTDGTAILVDATGADACKILGVLLNKPNTDEECLIARAPSIVPVVLGANMTAHQLGMVDVSDSTTIVATDGAIVLAEVLYAGSDGETVAAILRHGQEANVSLHNTGS